MVFIGLKKQVETGGAHSCGEVEDFPGISRPLWNLHMLRFVNFIHFKYCRGLNVQEYKLVQHAWLIVMGQKCFSSMALVSFSRIIAKFGISTCQTTPICIIWFKKGGPQVFPVGVCSFTWWFCQGFDAFFMLHCSQKYPKVWRYGEDSPDSSEISQVFTLFFSVISASFFFRNGWRNQTTPPPAGAASSMRQVISKAVQQADRWLLHRFEWWLSMKPGESCGISCEFMVVSMGSNGI